MAGGPRWTVNAVARRAAGIACTIALLLILPDAAVAAPPSAPAGKNWRPPACPPPPAADKGSSRLKVTGPCALEFTGDAECDTEYDDMLLIAKRKAKNGAELMIYINVERYVGAGRYKPPNDLYVSVKDKGTIYRWSANDFEATIGPGSRFVTVKNVKLDPELPLIGCSGPQTNYQCDGRGNDAGHMDSTTTVTGTLHCKASPPRKPS